MPDLFGREFDDYQHLAALPQRIQDQYLASGAHDFNALGSRRGEAMPDERTQVQAAGAGLSFNLPNSTAVIAMIDEVLYGEARMGLVPTIQVPEGARTYTRLVLDQVGEAAFLDPAGGESPAVDVNFKAHDFRLAYGGNHTMYTNQEWREAEFMGLPLVDAKLKAAVMFCLRHYEKVTLNGSAKEGFVGLLNLETAKEAADRPVRETASQSFEAASGQEIFRLIEDQIIAMIDSTKEVIGGQLRKGLCICLPVKQAGMLKQKLITEGDASMTAWKYLMQHSIWSAYSPDPIELRIITELSTAGNSDSSRMIIMLKDERVIEQGMAFMPRLAAAGGMIDQGYNWKIPLEYRFGGVNLYRPFGVRYVDGI